MGGHDQPIASRGPGSPEVERSGADLPQPVQSTGSLVSVSNPSAKARPAAESICGPVLAPIGCRPHAPSRAEASRHARFSRIQRRDGTRQEREADDPEDRRSCATGRGPHRCDRNCVHPRNDAEDQRWACGSRKGTQTRGAGIEPPGPAYPRFAPMAPRSTRARTLPDADTIRETLLRSVTIYRRRQYGKR